MISFIYPTVKIIFCLMVSLCDIMGMHETSWPNFYSVVNEIIPKCTTFLSKIICEKIAVFIFRNYFVLSLEILSHVITWVHSHNIKELYYAIKIIFFVRRKNKRDYIYLVGGGVLGMEPLLPELAEPIDSIFKWHRWLLYRPKYYLPPS